MPVNPGPIVSLATLGDDVGGVGGVGDNPDGTVDSTRCRPAFISFDGDSTVAIA